MERLDVRICSSLGKHDGHDYVGPRVSIGFPWGHMAIAHLVMAMTTRGITTWPLGDPMGDRGEHLVMVIVCFVPIPGFGHSESDLFFCSVTHQRRYCLFRHGFENQGVELDR